MKIGILVTLIFLFILFKAFADKTVRDGSGNLVET
jgi:hypothetical protein